MKTTSYKWNNSKYFLRYSRSIDLIRLSLALRLYKPFFSYLRGPALAKHP